MSLTDQDAQELLTFLRSQVSKSRFAVLDFPVIEAVSNDRGLERVIRYLDLFVQMAGERSSGMTREIEGTLDQFLEVDGGEFKGVDIELPVFESELRRSTFLSLRNLGDSEDLFVRLKQLSSRLKEETGQANAFEPDEN